MSNMTKLETLQYVRRVILKHKVRQFALNELCTKFGIEQLQAKVVYFAAVNGCSSATVKALVSGNKQYAVMWAEARESLNLIKGL